MESVICDFRARSSESRILVGKLFSFYDILGLHSAFRNVTPHINEKALVHIFVLCEVILLDYYNNYYFFFFPLS